MFCGWYNPTMADGDFQLFPTTHWSLVTRAGQEPSASQRDALGDLLKRYLPAFRTFLMSKYRLDRDRAEDVVGGFVASRIVERNLVGTAKAGHGKFRNFLMTALERYAIDTFREEAAQKRGGGVQTDDIHEPGRDVGDRGAGDPAAAFDAAWAREVVAQAVARMRDATEKTRPDLWGVFHDRLLGPAFDGTQPSAYAELIDRLGFKDEGQAANSLQTAKRIFARILRGVVGEYEASATDVDEEVREVMGMLR